MHIRNIQSEEEFQAVLAVAKADKNHRPLMPTQVIRRDNKEGEILGCLSILPSVLFWLHSEKVTARESKQTNEFVEGHLSAIGNRGLLVPCTVDSPLRPFLTRVGYIDVANVQLYAKSLIIH